MNLLEPKGGKNKTAGTQTSPPPKADEADRSASGGEEEAIQDMNALYEESFKNLKEGATVEGTVITVQPGSVVVDIGYKSEGLIPSDEFSEDELATLKAGDRIQVYMQEREDNEGNLILSKEKAAKMKVWESLERAYEKGETVEGRILAKIKGGLVVDIGVKAFLPGSQIDLRPIRDLDGLVGRTFPMK